MPLCIYAVVRSSPSHSPSSSGRRVASRGHRGERLSLVRAGRLAAVAGAAARAPRPDARTLRDYHRAIDRLAAEFDALLPVRFGTIVANEEEVRLVLQHRQAVLRAALAGVRRRVQMTLRFVAPVVSPLEKRVRDTTSGLAYLQSRAAEKRLREGGAEGAALASAVRRFVRGERVETRGRVVSVYHLVPRSAVAPYLRAIDAVRASGAAVTVTGPFPPFAFAEPLSSVLPS